MTQLWKLFGAAALGLALGGCAALEEFLSGERVAEAPVIVPLAERTPLEPLDPHRFVLESADQGVIGAPQVVFSRDSDTFSEIAREYGLGYDEIVAANPDIDPWLPGEGSPVLLPTQYVLPDAPRRGIVLNIAAKRLFYFPETVENAPQIVLTYPIGIGRVGWETPLGEAEIISKARDPSWWVPASVRKEHAELGDPLPPVVPPGPDNPLGKFVLKLDMPGYLIHGTNQPYGVGMRVSHGCVRLYPENIEVLYSLVGLGEPVRIVNQPYLAGWLGGELYFEGHPALEDDDVPAAERMLAVLDAVDGEAVDRTTLAQQFQSAADDARGVPLRIRRNDSFEVFERARVVQNTVEPDPEGPTLAEVRAILDTPLEEFESESEDGDGGNAAQ